MQDAILLDALAAQPPEHVLEISQVRFVGADFFRRHHAVETHTELARAERETLVVDVGKNVELVVRLEIAKCGSGVEKWLPRFQRARERRALFPRRRRAPVFGETLVDDAEQLRIL